MSERSHPADVTRHAPGAPARRLLAMNHFANPLDAPGGTRLIELSERLDGWDTTIIAASRNLFTRSSTRSPRRRGRARRTTGPRRGSAPVGTDRPGAPHPPDYRTVWTTPYTDNGAGRVVNWMSYALVALVVGWRQPRPDVVYASSPHLLTGLSGWVLARARGVPFVLEVRDLWPQILADTGRLSPDSGHYRAVKRLERFLYRRADAIVVLTEGVAREVADTPAHRIGHRRIDPAKIHLIPNGADPADFEIDTPRQALRRRFGFDGVTFVYAGAHGPANGLDFVLEAALELRDDQPDAQFVLVGDGLSKAGLVARAAELGLDNVRFLDPIPKNEIPALLSAADVGVHVLGDLPLFLYGVSPNKLFDYMAAGLPVLTNTAGEVGDLVKGQDAGVVVGPAGLAGGVRQIVAAGEAQRAAWGANGREVMSATRSRSLMAARLQAVLDHLVP
jgi:glycosyltransferase involved in cell wall biosynthesis